MQTEPPFNIEPPVNPCEIKPVEKIHPFDNDQPENAAVPVRETATKPEEDEEEKPTLPPDPFDEKGNKIDVLG